MTYKPLIDGVSIKRINGESLLSSGNIDTNSDRTELLLKFNAFAPLEDVIVDESKNNYLVASAGSTTISTGATVFGYGSLYLDGDSWLSLSPIDFKGSFTIECWLKILAQGNFNSIIGQCFFGIPSDSWVIYVRNGTIFYYNGNYDSSIPLIESTAQAINDDQWHHIALVRNKNKFYLYIDGFLDAENLLSSGFLNTINANPILIGYDNIDGYFNGYIENIRISSKAIYTPILYPNGFTLPDENFNVTAL